MPAPAIALGPMQRPWRNWAQHDQQRLKRIEERQESGAIGVAQLLELLPDGVRLPFVTPDRLLARERQSVMHETVACAQPPQRSRLDLIGSRSVLVGRLNRNPVTRSDVVHQKVAVRMDDLVADSRP